MVVGAGAVAGVNGAGRHAFLGDVLGDEGGGAQRRVGRVDLAMADAGPRMPAAGVFAVRSVPARAVPSRKRRLDLGQRALGTRRLPRDRASSTIIVGSVYQPDVPTLIYL